MRRQCIQDNDGTDIQELQKPHNSEVFKQIFSTCKHPGIYERCKVYLNEHMVHSAKACLALPLQNNLNKLPWV